MLLQLEYNTEKSNLLCTIKTFSFQSFSTKFCNYADRAGGRRLTAPWSRRKGCFSSTCCYRGNMAVQRRVLQPPLAGLGAEDTELVWNTNMQSLESDYKICLNTIYTYVYFYNNLNATNYGGIWIYFFYCVKNRMDVGLPVVHTCRQAVPCVILPPRVLFVLWGPSR